MYDELRERDTGAHWAEELGGWMFTRYDDVRRIYNDHSTFSSERYAQMAIARHGPAWGEQRRFMDISTQQFMLTDPPAHTEIRAILRSAFTPRGLTRWRQVVSDLTDELLDEISGRRTEVDFMTDFAPRVPVAVIGTMLGIPRRDWARFRTWTDAFVETFDPRAVGARRKRCVATTLDMFDYLAATVARRRLEPAEDLITLVATAQLGDGHPMPVSRAVAQLALLLAAGNETTANLIGNGVTILIDNPAVQRRLCADPALLPLAIEEMLRLDPPFHVNPRKVTRAITLGGQQLEPGQICYQVLAAANRDPRAFTDPAQFSFDRRANQHLAFIHGVHFCLGAPLARMEAEAVFSKLLARFPHFCAGAGPAIRSSGRIITRGWLRRPVSLTPADRG